MKLKYDDCSIKNHGVFDTYVFSWKGCFGCDVGDLAIWMTKNGDVKW